MKKLNVKTKYSGAASFILALNKFLSLIFLIGAIIFVIVAIAEGESGFLIGTASCLILLFVNWLSNAKLSAITGIAKAAEYYMAIVEDENYVSETIENEKIEKFIDIITAKSTGGTKELPYKVGDFVYCKPKGMTVVVLSIKGNNISCGAENENGEMVEIGTFTAEDISSLD